MEMTMRAEYQFLSTPTTATYMESYASTTAVTAPDQQRATKLKIPFITRWEDSLLNGSVLVQDHEMGIEI